MKFQLKNKISKGTIYILLTTLIMIVLLVLDIGVSNTFVLYSDFTGFNNAISILTPESRTDGSIINEEPVYFDVDLPNIYKSVSVDLDYYNPDNDRVEIGLIRGNGMPELKLLEYKTIDSLGWKHLISPYESYLIRPDMSSEPTYERTGFFQYNTGEATQATYEPIMSRSINLKGSQLIKVLTGDVPLSFKIIADSDVSVTVITSPDFIFSKEYKVNSNNEIDIENMKPGVHELRIDVPDDVEYSFEINSNKWMFADGINVGDVDGPVKLLTNAIEVTVVTDKNKGLQDLLFGDDVYPIDRTHKQVKIIAKNGVEKIQLEHGAIRIVGRGVFAQSDELFFETYPRDIQTVVDINSDIDKIITQYSPDNDITFDLDRKLNHRFIISIPGVERHSPVKINSIKLTFKKDGFNVKDYIKVWAQRIKNL